MAQSLIIPRSEVVRGARHEHALPWRVVLWVAAVLTLVGWLDVAFLWAPLSIGEMGWRFEVIAATVDSLPLATIGLTAVLMACVHRESKAGLACVATFGALTCMALLVLGAWFVANGLRMQSPDLRDGPAQIEILRTSIFAFIYIIIYALITSSAAQRLLANHDASSPH